MRSCLCAPLFSTTLTIHSGKRNMLLDCLQPIHTPQYEARLDKLIKRLADAEKQEQDALARRDGAIEAKSILSSASLGDSDMPSRAYSGSPHSKCRYMLFHPAWYCYKDSWSGIVTVRSYWAQPDIKYPE